MKKLIGIYFLSPLFLIAQIGESNLIYNHTEYESGNVIASGDINNDGFDDILIHSDIGVQALFGSATGLSSNLIDVYAFVDGAGHSNQKNSQPLVDVDGDGDLDLVHFEWESSLNPDAPTYWSENDGNGQFSGENIIHSGPVYLRAADLDGDGDMDFYTHHDEFINSTGWFENDNQSFVYHQLYGSSNFNFHINHVQAADFNTDGIVDLVYQEYMNPPDSTGLKYQMKWMQGTGSGEFLDGIFYSSQNISLFGSSNFSDRDYYLIDTNNDDSLETIAFTRDVPVFYEDLDSDGDLDRIKFAGPYSFGYGTNGPQYININLANNGTFDAQETKHEFHFNPRAGNLFFSGDYNADGYTDFVLGSQILKKVILLENQGDNTFEESYPVQMLFDLFHALIPMDLDNDSDEDLLLFSSDQKLVQFINQGNGTYSEPEVIQHYTEGNIKNFKAIDINNDNLMDMVFSVGNRIHISWGQASGMYSDEELLLDHEATTYTSQNLSLFDINSDGFVDMLIRTGGNLFYAISNSGSFSAIQQIPTSSTFSWNHLFIDDFNQDGFLDFIARNSGSDQVELFLNSAGSFGSSQIIYSGEWNTSFPHPFIGDPDLDGDVDFLFQSQDYDLQILQNDGNGNFSNPTYFSNLPGDYSGTKFLELTGDGLLDIYSREHIALGLGNGLYSSAIDLSQNIYFPIFRDLSQDGLSDIISFPKASFSSDLPSLKIEWFENQLNSNETASGSVFLDSISNGVFDQQEPGLGPVSLYFPESDTYQFISQNSPEYVHFLYPGEHQVLDVYDNMLWHRTSDYSFYNFDLNGSDPVDTLDFGYVPIGEQEVLTGSIAATSATCNSSSIIQASAFNEGNTLGYGTYQIEIDTLFEIVGMNYGDSINGNIAFASFDSLYFNSIDNLQIIVENPNENSTGVPWCHYIYVYNQSNVLMHTDSICGIITCAYDPNDKQEFTGYTDEGYILGDNPLEYLIRFQNTGNAPATDVVLKDVISEHLDKETIQVIQWSHPFEFFIDQGSVATFTFNDIQLPDSGSNFLESQGFVKFKIMPNSNLEVGTQIYNTANIYFDSNAPVITNTTLNTIFDCEGLADFTVEEELCTGQVFEASSTALWIEDYSWTWDNTNIGDESNLLFTFDDVGSQWIHFEASNALCQQADSILVNVTETPLSFAGPDTAFCGMEGIVLASENGFPGFWSSSDAITFGNENEPESTISADAQGSYNLFWTSSNAGCESSDSVNITFYEIPWVEIDAVDGILYANTLGDNYQWYFNGVAISGANEASYAPTENGEYTVTVEGQNDCVGESEVYDFLIDRIAELENFNLYISPNPAKDYVWIEVFSNGSYNFKIELIDQQGRLVRSENFNSKRLKLDLKDLESGMYLLNLRIADGQLLKTEKMILD